MNNPYAYNMLAMAIISRAMLDIKNPPSNLGGTDKRTPEEIRNDAKEFIRSDWAMNIVDICSIPKGVLTIES